MKLFRVTIEHETYVLAMDAQEACDIARDEAIPSETLDALAVEVTGGDIAKSGWSPKALPWGGDNNQTLADVWPK